MNNMIKDVIPYSKHKVDSYGLVHSKKNACTNIQQVAW